MSLASLRFAPGQFYGGTSLSYSSHGIRVTHRVADRPPEQVLRHTHTDAHFVLVAAGDYVSVADGRPASGCPVLIYNPPGTTHNDHFKHGRGSFFAISMEPSKVSSVAGESSLPDGPLHLTAMSQFAIARRIAESCTSRAGGLELDALCHELLGSMDRQAQQESRKRPPWLSKAVELLYDRYTEELSIADIASGVGIHRIHLARSFRQYLRCTPADFARSRRLEMAIAMLTRSTRPLTEIALSCGFSDQSHLSKALSRHLGLPPGQYRRVAGGQDLRARTFQIDKSEHTSWYKIGARSRRPVNARGGNGG